MQIKECVAQWLINLRAFDCNYLVESNGREFEI